MPLIFIFGRDYVPVSRMGKTGPSLENLAGRLPCFTKAGAKLQTLISISKRIYLQAAINSVWPAVVYGARGILRTRTPRIHQPGGL